jgi:hypothetical protein
LGEEVEVWELRFISSLTVRGKLLVPAEDVVMKLIDGEVKLTGMC